MNACGDRSQFIIASSVTTAVCRSNPSSGEPYEDPRRSDYLSVMRSGPQLCCCAQAQYLGALFYRIAFVPFAASSLHPDHSPSQDLGGPGGFSERPVQTPDSSQVPPADSSTGPGHLGSADQAGANCSQESRRGRAARGGGATAAGAHSIPGICQTDFMFRVYTCRC